MSIARHHAEWLSLVEVSGPFLSMPVLLRVFPQGLDAHDAEVSRGVRRALEEWQNNQQGLRPDPAIHTAWVRFVLREVLGFPDDLLASGPAIPESIRATVAEHGEILRPDLVILRSGQPARLLVQVVPPAQDLDKPLRDHRWKASPATRMAELLRGTGVRLGLLTNGERWMLVHAQPGETAGFASWYASLWLDEPVTLRAFRSLLGVERLFGVADPDTLEALLTESAANQQEVTDQLGYQVREAVEMLVQTLDRIDKDGGRTLLANVTEATIYEAALTVMMRLVFLFSAEERDLLLLGKPMYDQHYAVSTLRAQLRAAADETGEEVLERRHDAWSRLLATFRAVSGGVQHEDLRLPAYGGHLFDPDRFPFLEGRAPDTRWIDVPAHPLSVDNRTVLHLLEALQILRVKVPGGGPAEPRRLSFRALDIEQIGHVYEGLLDHTAKRAAESVLGLVGSKDREPEVALSRLEALFGDRGSGARDRGAASLAQASLFDGAPSAPSETDPRSPIPDPLLTFLREETGRSASALEKALAITLEPRDLDALRAACDNDADLVERVRPFAGLLRRDTFGRPVVITTGSLYVTSGTDRRTSGTHYTPRSLTEPIVQHTLDPLVYHGPAEGLPREAWTLRSAEHILSLHVCDMAMGSGAFLVQVCRYMSERLAEAWEAEEGLGSGGSGLGEEGSEDDATVVSRPGGVAAEHGSRGGDLPADQALAEDRAVWADESDAPGRDLNPVEYRRGLRPDSSQGVRPSPLDRPGVAPRGGDATPDYGAAGVCGSRAGQEGLEPYAGSRQDASPTDRLTVAQTRRSGLAPSPQPPAPSTSPPDPRPETRDPEERLAQARRLIADRCLYGVDKNPLAVEMAKLSLWLITLAKGRPFSFLDHALRVGDSLLGLAHIDQLLHWSLGKTSGPTTATFLTEPLRRALQRAIALRRKIRETPVIDVRDAERKAGWLREAEEALGLVRLAADLLVAAALHPEKKRRAELSDEFQYRMSLAAEAWESVQRGGAGAPRGDANREELAALRREADALLAGRQPFHWPLEFPEVFLSGLGSRVSGLEQEDARVFDEVLDAARVGNLDPIDPISETRDAGFAAIVGNPPFQGGQKITGALGVPYRDYLVEFLAHGKRGSADLCAYFFLRAGGMLQQHGQAGLIATNTIAQGDTREVGLDQLVAAGFAIPRAVPSRPWPGLAAVEVAHVWVRKGAWRSSYLLNEATVSGITPSLSEPGLAVGNPYKLKANEGKSFQGSIVLGMGFVLEPEEAQALIAKDPRNAEALFPYLNGEDLNSRPDQSPSRWVINFHDWPLEQAETYPDLMAIVKEKVKPERDKITYSKAAVENWWQHERGRVEQYKIVRKKKSVLVASRVTKYVAHVYFSTDIIFDVAVNVLMDYTGGNFSTVESSLYKTWVREFASTMKMDTRYTLTDCFETFPFTADRGSGISEQGSGGHASEPRSLNPDPRTPNPNPLASIGETYHAHRKAIMADRDEGLTKTYNRFHSPDEQSADIAELRRLHVAMDNAVAAAYGWEDLDLGHGFHETKQGLRYTISEAARRVVLDRLLALNHQRYKEEVEAGLHDRGSGAGGRGSAKGGRKKQGGSELEGQGRLL